MEERMGPVLQIKHKEQTREIYAAIGLAAVNFEGLCFALRTAIVRMLESHGLNNQQVSQTASGRANGAASSQYFSVPNTSNID
jgi:hypothetical protein